MRDDQVQITVDEGESLSDDEAKGLLAQLDREVPNWTGAKWTKNADGTWNAEITAPDPPSSIPS